MSDAIYSATTPLFLPYLNLQQGIRIDYPANWAKEEQNAPAGFMVIFCSPRENFKDQFSENVNLFIEPLPSGVSLDQYFQSNLQTFGQMPVKFLDGGTAAVLGGYPAYRIVLEGPLQTAEGAPLSGKFLQLMSVHNSRGYVLTYTAEMQKFDTFLPPVNRMIASLEIQ